MEADAPCLSCMSLTEKIKRLEHNLKRTQADLAHQKHLNSGLREELTENLPEPDTVAEPVDPTRRFVPRPPLF
jgi:hypothetical protein